MKRRIIAFFLLIVSAFSLLASCSGSKEEAEAEESTEISTPIFDSYSDFVDKKTDLFGKFTTDIYGNKELVRTVGNRLLSLSTVDIAFLPLSLLQSAEKNGGSFSGNAKGYYNCTASIEGGYFDLYYTTYNDENQQIKGYYDAESGSLYAEKYESGVMTYSIEYIPSEDGYKAQYAIRTGEKSVSQILFSSEKCGAAVSESESVTRLAEISDEDFLKSDALCVIEENGSFHAVSDGEDIYA